MTPFRCHLAADPFFLHTSFNIVFCLFVLLLDDPIFFWCHLAADLFLSLCTHLSSVCLFAFCLSSSVISYTTTKITIGLYIIMTQCYH